MSTNVGSIKYTVEAETGELLTAEKVVDKSTDSMAKDFKKVDDAVKKTNLEVKKTAKAVDAALKSEAKSAERAARTVEREAERKAKSTERAAERAKVAAEKASNAEIAAARRSAAATASEAKKAAIEVQAASDRATKATVVNQKRQTVAAQKQLASRGRATGQVGIQIQQLVGQIQGGQNVMQAFSAQVADIGIVAGAPMLGVLAAFGFAIAGPFVTAMGLGVSATEKLDKAMEALDKTVQDKDGVKTYTKAIGNLAKESESAARLMVMAAQENATEAGRAAAESIGESFNDSFDVAFFQKSFDALKNIAGTSAGVGYSISQEYKDLGEQFGFTGSAARDAGESVLISLREMQQAVDSSAPDAGTKIVAFQEKLSELAKTSEGKNKTKLLKFVTAIDDYVIKAKKAGEMTEFLKKTMSDVGLSMPTEETEKQKTVIDSMVESLKSQQFALENNEEATFRYAAAQQLGLKLGEQLPANVDAQITALFKLKAAKDATKEDEAKTKAVKSAVGSIGLSPEDVLKQRLEKEQMILDEAANLKLISEENYLARSEELNSQHEQKLKALNDKSKEEQLINWESIENQAVGSLAAIATGAMTGKEAMRSLAQSILTQMVGSLIKMGIQAVIGQTTIATTTAASMVAIAASAAPAAALVSLATAGANSPLAVTGMATAATAASAIALPGRQFGGGVSSGNAYRVGEAGPEILQQGGKNYMIPGQSGNVISNSEMGGGGTTININNMANGVDVQARPSADGKTIEIAVRQAVAEMTNQVASGNGQFVRALRSNTNMTSKASR